jgi:hypothetical protein
LRARHFRATAPHDPLPTLASPTGLERIGLAHAVPNFHAMGVDSPQALMLIDVKTYDALGIHNGAACFERARAGVRDGGGPPRACPPPPLPRYLRS